MVLHLPEPHRHLRNIGGHIDLWMFLYVETLCAYASYVVQKYHTAQMKMVLDLSTENGFDGEAFFKWILGDLPPAL